MQFKLFVLMAVATTAIAQSEVDSAIGLQRRTCGTLTGTPLTICQDACKLACNAVTGTLLKKACKAACDAGPLKVREAEALPAEEVDSLQDLKDHHADQQHAHIVGQAIAMRSIGQTLCDAACDVACNSTVLALAQTKCLKACKAKC